MVEIKVLEEGVGRRIEVGEKATLSYELELPDGTFIERAGINNPYTFTLGSTETISGLSEGVEGMQISERRLLTIPPELAYGDRDVGKIPPNSTLHFEVELLQIRKAGGAEEDEGELSDKFQTEDFLNNRHAENITKPAMFEYLIRDFFTKPWRYEDGHLKIWRATGKVFFCFLLVVGLAHWGRKKQWWIL